MELQQQQAVLTIALFAAFADGNNDDREREQIRQIADSLGHVNQQAELSRLYQDVLFKRVSLPQVAALLHDVTHRQFAYEMAVCICDADGLRTAAEQQFLQQLRSLLQLDSQQTQSFEQQSAAFTQSWAHTAPPAPSPTPSSGLGLFAGLAAGAAAGGIAAAAMSPSPTPQYPTPAPTANTGLRPANVTEAQLDRTVMNYSLLNGALELLPQSWASMAIIPLQMKMVHQIGKHYGYELDSGHIKEWLATIGVGLTSQYVEQFGRKLLGGLFGKVGGKTGKKVGDAATGMAFSFATTYAMGQLARRYYAGGRTMNSATLRESFQGLLGSAKQLQAQSLPQIQQRAQGLNPSQVMDLVRGKQLL